MKINRRIVFTVRAIISPGAQQPFVLQPGAVTPEGATQRDRLQSAFVYCLS
jgi:hypothetical protein